MCWGWPRVPVSAGCTLPKSKTVSSVRTNGRQREEHSALQSGYAHPSSSSQLAALSCPESSHGLAAHAPWDGRSGQNPAFFPCTTHSAGPQCHCINPEHFIFPVLQERKPTPAAPPAVIRLGSPFLIALKVTISQHTYTYQARPAPTSPWKGA